MHVGHEMHPRAAVHAAAADRFCRILERGDRGLQSRHDHDCTVAVGQSRSATKRSLSNGMLNIVQRRVVGTALAYRICPREIEASEASPMRSLTAVAQRLTGADERSLLQQKGPRTPSTGWNGLAKQTVEKEPGSRPGVLPDQMFMSLPRCCRLTAPQECERMMCFRDSRQRSHRRCFACLNFRVGRYVCQAVPNQRVAGLCHIPFDKSALFRAGLPTRDGAS
jgi:hypothetical protein